jgi:uncharacterized protein
MADYLDEFAEGLPPGKPSTFGAKQCAPDVRAAGVEDRKSIFDNAGSVPEPRGGRPMTEATSLDALHPFVVIYRYGDTAELRAIQRPAHREFLRQLWDRGALVLSGPFDDDEEPGALLIVMAGSSDEVAHLLDADPLCSGGLVENREIRRYRVAWGVLVLGEQVRGGNQ